MGKKDPQPKPKCQPTLDHKLFDELMIKKKSVELKDFLWSCLKKNKITMKTESTIREYVNRVSGSNNIQSEIDLMLTNCRLFSKTKQIFKGLSLKQKYSNLLRGSLEEVKEEQRVVLLQPEADLLNRISKAYEKYRVSSMFRRNLLKEVPDASLDSLIAKGYLREICPKEKQEHSIIFLVS